MATLLTRSLAFISANPLLKSPHAPETCWRHFSSFASDEVLLAVKREALEEQEWARLQRPTGARPLEPPGLEFCPRLVKPFKFPTSLEAYLENRRWPVNRADATALRILSGLLTYPLTLGEFLAWWHEHRGMLRTGGEEATSRPKDGLRIVCLGARAEASLPLPWWREMMCVTHPDQYWSGVDLHMIGPEVPPNLKDSIIPFQPKGGSEGTRGSSSDFAELRVHFNSTVFHQTVIPMDPDKDLSFVLFNPGIGHPALKESWRPTLREILRLKVPVFWSGHSEKDRDRDLAELESYGVRWLQMPRANYFQSRRRVMDPLDPGHVVAANAYAGCFVGM